MEMRPALALAAISLAFAWGDPGHAAGVFFPVDSPAPASSAAQASAGQARQSRFMRIAHNELQRARAEVGNFDRSHLVFNVSEHIEFNVAVERTAQTADGYTLSGHIDGGKGGFVTLAVHEQVVAGSIWTWEAEYEILPVGGGVHAVRQVMDEPLKCHGVVQAPLVEPTAPASTSTANDQTAVVDILVFWTPALEVAKGGERHAKLTIDLAIAYANDVLERSGALVSLNLVGSELLDVPETSVDQLFGALGDVHATERADTVGADFLSVFHSGRFHSAATVTTTRPYTPISVNGPPHARVFSHEAGHNLGLLHDRGALNAPSYSYNGGHIGIAEDYALTRCDRTTMAYPRVCESAFLRAKDVPYYSTPNRHHPVTGKPLGVSRLSSGRGWDGPADAVLAINRNRHHYSNIRPSRSRP